MPMCLTPCSSGTFHTVLSNAFIRFLLSLRVVTTSYTWLPPLSLTLRKPPKAGYPLHPHAVAVKHATLNLQQNLMLALTYLPPWLWNMPWPHADPHLPTTHRGCETCHDPTLTLTYQPHTVAVKHAMTPRWPSLITHTPWLWNKPWPHADPHLPTTHRGCETCHDPMLTLTYQPHTVAVKHAMTPRWPSLTNHTPWLWNMPWPTLTLTYQPHTVAVKHAMTPRWPSLTNHTPWLWNMPWPHADPHLPTTHRGCETCHDPTLTLTYQPHSVAMNLQQNLMLAKAAGPATDMHVQERHQAERPPSPHTLFFLQPHTLTKSWLQSMWGVRLPYMPLHKPQYLLTLLGLFISFIHSLPLPPPLFLFNLHVILKNLLV